MHLDPPQLERCGRASSGLRRAAHDPLCWSGHLAAQDPAVARPLSEDLRGKYWRSVDRGFLNRRDTFQAHDHLITAIKMAGDMLVTGAYDGRVKVWSLATTHCRATFDAHRSAVTALDIEADTLVTGSRDRTAQVWSLPTRRQQHTLRHPVPVIGVMVVRKEAFTVLDHCPDRIMHWSLTTGDLLAQYHAHPPFNFTLAKAAGEAVMLSRGWTHTIVVSLTTGAMLATLDGLTRDGLVAGSNVVALTGDGRSVQFWALPEGNLERTLDLEGDPWLPYGAEVKGDTLVGRMHQGDTRIWSLVTGRLRHMLDDPKSHASAVAVGSDTIATGFRDGRVTLARFGLPPPVRRRGHIPGRRKRS